ncbi:trypsin Tyr p 3.0101-like [Contarinia nasturtii]|uniref:trypsin Tyr p 3.0101-like n=1 Tax=Contarinia nasturtii TaxID=265458 RepID=UPI0012D420C0|nr:trypsin Tyr p 3.0101-like [Contarinia nasturtii]
MCARWLFFFVVIAVHHSNSERQGRIKKGETAPIIPYHVSIDFDSDYKKLPMPCAETSESVCSYFGLFGCTDVPYAAVNNTKSLCSGVIIGERDILTAAHCVDEFKNRTEYMSVSVSVTDLRNVSQYQRYCVDRVIVHDDYSPTIEDIAMVKLKRKIDLSDPKKVKKLPFSNRHALFSSKDRFRVAGWGMLDESQTIDPNNLQQTTVEATDCPFEGVKNLNKLICAVSPDRSSTACAGDSGAGLVTLNEPQELIGILNRGECLTIDTAIMRFARVSTYYDWINKHLNDAVNTRA